MSQAHDGPRTFFPFGNPFQAIIPKSHFLRGKLCVPLASFEESLALSIGKLIPSHSSDVLSLSWMKNAVECLLEIYTGVEILVTELKFPVSGWDEKWLDVYLNSSLKLLDICIALNSELSRLEQSQLLLRHTLHVLGDVNSLSVEQMKQAHFSLEEWMTKVATPCPKLGICLDTLQSLAESLELPKVKNSAKGKVLMRALYGVIAVSIFICGALAAALSGHPKPLMEPKVNGEFHWCQVFGDLKNAVDSAVSPHGSTVMVGELEAALACAARLHTMTNAAVGNANGAGTVESFSPSQEAKMQEASIETEDMAVEGFEHHKKPPVCCDSAATPEDQTTLAECISCLAKCAEKLGVELDLLSQFVSDFFKVVLTGRDALLCNLRS